MDIAIAGAGIAGLATASFLAREGHRVVVYDQLAAPAPVGSGVIIQPTGQSVLAELGLTERLFSMGAKLKQLDGRTEGGRRRVLDVRYNALGDNVVGVAIHRAALFDLLFRAASDAGVEFQYAYEVTDVIVDGDRTRLLFSNGRQVGDVDLIVDALGVRSPLIERQGKFLDFGALWANVPFPSGGKFSEEVLAQRYRSADTSAGVMPIGRLQQGGPAMAAFFWTLRADKYDEWLATPLDVWKGTVLTLWPEAAPVLANFRSHDDFVFAQYAHHTNQRPVEGRIVHIGDAWHAASPQLGQGANMALLDALSLQNALRAENNIEAALAQFEKSRRFHVRLYQAISHLFTPVYQSNSKILPALRDLLAEPLSRLWPMPRLLASIVAGSLGEKTRSNN